MSDPTPSDGQTLDAELREPPAMIKADLVAAVVLIVLACAILYSSWTMPRLEERRINPFTVPGLVPGMLSFALLICGGILGFRSLHAPAAGGWSQLGGAIASYAAMRAGVVMALALIYSLGLVGLIPFWAATALFVLAFVLVFETWLAEPRRPLLNSLPWALGLAIVTAAAVTIVFERAFLVRLP
jgi:putative tricarboxylic transport membrane protein